MQERLVSKSGPDRPPVRLTPLPVPKASDVLADDLRERILLGEVPEGTALPTERDLVAQTHMSRATVREALRILEVQGLIRIKTGRAGGACPLTLSSGTISVFSIRLRASPGRQPRPRRGPRW